MADTKAPPQVAPKKSMTPSPVSMRTSKPAENLPFVGKAKKGSRPPKCLFMADNGWGKTTIAAHAADPDETVIVMTHDETGFLTLLDNGLAPDCDQAVLETWAQLTALLKSWIDAPEIKYRVIVFDTMCAFERLLQKKVCDENFGGDMSSKGFGAWRNGPKDCLNGWVSFLKLLEDLNRRGATIMLLEQISMKQAKNPVGDDYLKFVLRSDDLIANVTKDWCSMVLFGRWVTITDNKDSEGKKAGTKGIGGTERVVVTSNHDAWTAKNQCGLPSVIEISEDITNGWETILSSREGRQA